MKNPHHNALLCYYQQKMMQNRTQTSNSTIQPVSSDLRTETNGTDSLVVKHIKRKPEM
jgi:hypothetical protein